MLRLFGFLEGERHQSLIQSAQKEAKRHTSPMSEKSLVVIKELIFRILNFEFLIEL